MKQSGRKFGNKRTKFGNKGTKHFKECQAYVHNAARLARKTETLETKTIQTLEYF
jgi:hypothetical protein